MALRSLSSLSSATRRTCSASSSSLLRHAVHSKRTVVTDATDQKLPLETTEDWTAFQLRKAEYRMLIDEFSRYGSQVNRDNTWQPHHSLHRPPSPSTLTLSALVAAGAHLGHNTTLMNPNFIPYAYGTRAGITIIDLENTVMLLRRAASLVRAVAANGGMIVFVGTRPELRGAVREAASRIGERGYHVGEKWLPGTLTNFVHVFGVETVEDTIVKPDLVVFLNPLQNMHAIRECAIQHVPTVGIIDSNADPRIVMYPIPANDESTRTAEIVAGVLSVAGREGSWQREEREEKRQETMGHKQSQLDRDAKMRSLGIEKDDA